MLPEVVLPMSEPIPENLKYYSADEVAECFEGLSECSYNELWQFVEDAEEAGTAKPQGGDGSDGTTEEPIVSSGEYGTDLVSIWDRLSDETKRDIVKVSNNPKYE